MSKTEKLRKGKFVVNDSPKMTFHRKNDDSSKIWLTPLMSLIWCFWNEKKNAKKWLKNRHYHKINFLKRLFYEENFENFYHEEKINWSSGQENNVSVSHDGINGGCPFIFRFHKKYQRINSQYRGWHSRVAHFRIILHVKWSLYNRNLCASLWLVGSL